MLDIQLMSTRTLPIETFQSCIPFKCFEHLPANIHVLDLKPLELNKADVEDLNIAEHKLGQYSDQLDNLVNEPEVTKKFSWFTILVIIIIVLLVVLYLMWKCRRRRSILAIQPANDDPPIPPSSREIRNIIRRRRNPRRRKSIHLGEPVEVEIELKPQKMRQKHSFG